LTTEQSFQSLVNTSRRILPAGKEKACCRLNIIQWPRKYYDTCHSFIQSVSQLVDQFFIHLKAGTKTMRTTGLAIATISIFNVLHALENTESDAINSLPLFHEKEHGG